MGPDPETPSPRERERDDLVLFFHSDSNPQSPDYYTTPPATTAATPGASSSSTTSNVTRRLSPQVKSSDCASPAVIKPNSKVIEWSSPTPKNTDSLLKQRTRRKKRGRRASSPSNHTYVWIVAWILSAIGFTSVGYYKRRKQHKTIVQQQVILPLVPSPPSSANNVASSSSLRALSDHHQQQQRGSLQIASSTPIQWEFTNVIHVIQTRLMQSQPDLIDLGLARLKIFQHFCLPSMQHQSSQNFLWIIRTDPNLDDRLKQELLKLVKPFPHFLVVASNSNPEGFRSRAAIQDWTPTQVWSGNLDLALAFHQAAQTRIVLESRLDADDGLHKSFVEYIQYDAEYFLSSDKNNDESDKDNYDETNSATKTKDKEDKNKWMVWCTRSHVEWQYSSPFSKTDDNSPHGYLVGIKRKDCVTPGVTMGFGLGTTRKQLPSHDHTKLHSVIPACTSERKTHCLFRYADKYPGAVRARTVTSAGMNRVIIGRFGDRRLYKHAGKQKNQQEGMWDGLLREFHITRQDAAATKSYIGDHLAEIAMDNLKGQCTHGHSCKKGSQQILKLMMEDPAGAIRPREK